jgi:hypothetical protein
MDVKKLLGRLTVDAPLVWVDVVHLNGMSRNTTLREPNVTRYPSAVPSVVMFDPAVTLGAKLVTKPLPIVSVLASRFVAETVLEVNVPETVALVRDAVPAVSVVALRAFESRKVLLVNDPTLPVPTTIWDR